MHYNMRVHAPITCSNNNDFHYASGVTLIALFACTYVSLAGEGHARIPHQQVFLP